jgi:hypothetical protein
LFRRAAYVGRVKSEVATVFDLDSGGTCFVAPIVAVDYLLDFEALCEIL